MTENEKILLNLLSATVGTALIVIGTQQLKISSLKFELKAEKAASAKLKRYFVKLLSKSNDEVFKQTVDEMMTDIKFYEITKNI